MAKSNEKTLAGDISRIRARKPLHVEIRETILQEFILSGRLKAGDRLPSETELAELFGASRVTIRSAIQGLKESGYIRVQRGTGSWLLPRPEAIHSGIDRLVSFDTFASQSGKPIGSANLEIMRVTPNEDPLLSPFGPIDGATRVSRVKTIDDKPVAWIVDYIPDYVMSLVELSGTFAGSVLDLLLARGIAAYSDCELTPIVAQGELSRYLDCAPGSPVLQLSELTRGFEDEIVNRSEAWFLPHAFTFHVRRRVET